ncbi:hypothetical protein [Streptomyces sp. NPDC088350]|uniref:hypothetical protein n=1 Tax=Streptomyces sp. NPDC088350 TaxID=3365854 RepID=UPI00382D1526
MTTTTDIARAHGHTGPTNCQDCGTPDNVHFGSWFNPETKEGGSFLQCCGCGIKAGDPIYAHTDCGNPATRYVPNVNSDPYGQLAFRRIQERAVEAYIGGQADAARCELTGREADAHAVAAVLEAVGRAYAAAALNQAAQLVIDQVDEDTYVTLGDIAATLDLDVVEDLDGANGTGADEGPEVRVLRRDAGWTFSFEPGVQPCTINRISDGRQNCPDMAVWKVVEDHGLHLTISTWCDGHLPDGHRSLAPRAEG